MKAPLASRAIAPLESARRPLASGGLLGLVLLVIGGAPACGFPQSNAVDVPRVDGVPVECTNVRMVQSLVAGLGGAEVTLSSSDGPNAIGIAYDVHVLDQAPAHSGVSAQISCRVGEHTIVSPLATDASGRLAAASPGTTLEERETFLPTPFSAEIPKVCETTLFYTIAPPLSAVPVKGDPPSPGPQLRPIGTVCFSDGELSVGACPREVLPRTAPTTAVEASRLQGRIGTVSSGNGQDAGYGVAVTVLVTAGEGAPENFLVGGEATCREGGETRDLPLGLLMFGQRLRPGEAIVQSASTPPREALASEPEWCTVRVQLAEDGAKRTLGEFCVRGDATTVGTCATTTLQPGPTRFR